MERKSILIIAAAVLFSYQTTWADVLELKNGQVVNGAYVGGTAGTVRFETAKGMQVYQTGEILALTFSGQKSAATAAPAVSTPAAASAGSAAPAAAATAAAAAATSAAQKDSTKSALYGTGSQVVVPADTMLLVRMGDGVSSNDEAGKRFTTNLETDLTVDGVVVAKAGTRIYGRVQGSEKAGRYAGKSKLDIRLTEIMINNALVPIVTGPFEKAGEGSLRKTARSAAVGTAIGAISDGSHGAGKGAAIGAVASGLKKGETVGIKSGELLEFKLQQPLNVTLQK